MSAPVASDTRSPPTGSRAAATWVSAWVTRTAGNCGTTGNGACFFYDGHSHPFLRLRGGTHPLARRTREPWPLVQAGQIRPAPLAGAKKPGARPTDRLAGQPGRRQPNRRSGRDPGSRRYAPVQSRSGKPRQKHYPQSPCRFSAAEIFTILAGRRAQISRFRALSAPRSGGPRSRCFCAGRQPGPAPELWPGFWRGLACCADRVGHVSGSWRRRSGGRPGPGRGGRRRRPRAGRLPARSG